MFIITIHLLQSLPVGRRQRSSVSLIQYCVQYSVLCSEADLTAATQGRRVHNTYETPLELVAANQGPGLITFLRINYCKP